MNQSTENNYFGLWHLAHISHKENHEAAQISILHSVDYHQIIADNKLIAEFFNSRELIDGVQKSKRDLIESIVQAGADFCETKQMNAHLQERILFEITYNFSNLINNFRIFIEHSNIGIKRAFGESSIQSKNWKTCQSEQYDTCFEYRFFYCLRNYIQHIGYPPISIRFIAKAETDAISLSATLKRDNLLLEESIWNSLLKKDLQQMPDEISIISCLENWEKTFFKLAEVLMLIRYEHVREAADRILSYRKNANIEPNVGEMVAIKMNGEELPSELNMQVKSLCEEKAGSILKSYL